MPKKKTPSNNVKLYISVNQTVYEHYKRNSEILGISMANLMHMALQNQIMQEVMTDALPKMLEFMSKGTGDTEQEVKIEK